MPYQAKFVLRHRGCDVRVGPASHYPKQSGWCDFAGVPASCKYGCQWDYNPAHAEREALYAIAGKVGVGDDEKTRQQNADLFWAALDAEYNAYNVHPIYRNQRPAEKQAA